MWYNSSCEKSRIDTWGREMKKYGKVLAAGVVMGMLFLSGCGETEEETTATTEATTQATTEATTKTTTEATTEATTKATTEATTEETTEATTETTTQAQKQATTEAYVAPAPSNPDDGCIGDSGLTYQ